MATIQQLAPQTAAVTTPIPFDAAAYPFVTVSADNLATTETITIYQAITPPGGTTIYTPAVNSEGGAASLTATRPACYLPGGLVYAFSKTVTAGLCGVYLSPDTGTSRGGTGSSAANDAAIAWAVEASGTVVYPEGFGALGDGTTDDTASLQSALTTGSYVELTAGKTYLVSKGLVMTAGQTLKGNGATIKRAAQVTTTTTTGITTGVTNVITVAAGTGANFTAGQTIAAFNGANYSTSNVIIDSIVGDVITTHTALTLSAGSPWSGTTTIAVSFHALQTTDDCKIYDLTADGNRANWTNYHWEITSEIHHLGIGATVQNCYLHDLPGEGILESTPGGNYLGIKRKYLNNRIVNANGNGIHLNGGSGTLIQGNTITDCSLDTVMGHVGGCVTFSQGNEDISILGNYFARARCGVGQISTSTRKVLIQGNTFEAIQLTANMTTNSITTSYAVEVPASVKDCAINDISVIGNKFYDCTPVAVMCTYTASTAKTITGITKAANAVVSSTAHGLVAFAVVRFAAVVGMVEINGLYGTVLSVNTNDFTVDIDTTAFTTYSSAGTAVGTYPMRYIFSGNQMNRCDKGAALTPVMPHALYVSGALTSVPGLNGIVIADNEITFKGNDIISYGINVVDAADATICGNVVKYGVAGVTIQNAGTNINVNGNTFSTQYAYGVFANPAGSNVSINNNVISADATSSTSYMGICLDAAGISCKANMLNIVQCNAGIRVQGVANCVVQANTVRAPSTKCIVVNTSSTGYVVTENQVTSAVVDTPGVAVRIGNNDIIV